MFRNLPTPFPQSFNHFLSLSLSLSRSCSDEQLESLVAACSVLPVSSIKEEKDDVLLPPPGLLRAAPAAPAAPVKMETDLADEEYMEEAMEEDELVVESGGGAVGGRDE